MSKMTALTTGLFMLFLCIQTVGAQFPFAGRLALRSMSRPQPERVTSRLNDLNIKAVGHFKRSYQKVENESWSLNQNGSRATFDMDGMHYLVDYTLKGNWRNTVRLYGESLLPEHIRWVVKTTFFDHEIVSVSDLHYGTIFAYFIKIEDGKHLKTVRIMNDEIEVLNEYSK